ncbi:hypothetical protein CsSME_00008172 [Camellia sinensis var. sinensis]
MSDRQINLTSPEQDSCTPLSSFEESSSSPLMDTVNEDANDVDNLIELEENARENGVPEDNNQFKRRVGNEHQKFGMKLKKWFFWIVPRRLNACIAKQDLPFLQRVLQLNFLGT